MPYHLQLWTDFTEIETRNASYIGFTHTLFFIPEEQRFPRDIKTETHTGESADNSLYPFFKKKYQNWVIYIELSSTSVRVVYDSDGCKNKLNIELINNDVILLTSKIRHVINVCVKVEYLVQ